MKGSKRNGFIYKSVIGKILVITLLGLFGAKEGSAQENFQKGYIIQTEPDTVFGEINYKDWVQNPDTIEFRRNTESPIELFTPWDLNTFSVSGEIYKSRETTIDETPFEILPGNQVIGTGKSTREARVFLEVLVQSEPIKLFIYRHGRENFYIEGPGGLVELISHEYTTTNTAGEHYVVKMESADFQIQLSRFYYFCNGQAPENTKYTQKSLIKFVLGCFQDSPGQYVSFVKEADKAKFKSAFYYALAITSFDVLFGWDYETFISFGDIALGYSAVIVLPRDRGKRRLMFDLEYQRLKAKNRDRYYNIDLLGTCRPSFGDCSQIEEFNVEKLTVDISYLKLNVGYKHLLFGRDFSPLVMIGTSARVRLSSESYGRISEVKYYHYHDTGEKIAYDSNIREGRFITPTKYTYAYYLGVGVQYKSASVTLKREKLFSRTNINSFRTYYLMFTVEYPFKFN